MNFLKQFTLKLKNDLGFYIYLYKKQDLDMKINNNENYFEQINSEDKAYFWVLL